MPTDDSDPPAVDLPVRLAKRVVELMRCSRQDAERLIEGGWVAVDGTVVEEPQWKVTGETVTIDPAAKPGVPEPATILLHKPAGVEFLAGPDAAQSLVRPETQSVLDDSGIRRLKRHCIRQTPLMPLEAAASGLLVLSQNPAMIRLLMEESASIEQEFIVEVAGEMAPYGLFKLCQGVPFQGRDTAPCKVSWQNEVRLRFAIKAVRPGQLVAMCSSVGLEVVAMKRIRIGRVALGKVAAGEWRYLPEGARF